jgi:hypothetical protein
MCLYWIPPCTRRLALLLGAHSCSPLVRLFLSVPFPRLGKLTDIDLVCAVSSRYYREKSEIYPIAMHFARHAAANALVDGWKSVELCQAYILLSTYGVPAKRWEEDRGWLYIGLAIRFVRSGDMLNVY